MPRIPPSLFRRAQKISPHAATLLPVCRDLISANNELRWIREHVHSLRSEQSPSAAIATELQIADMCRRRGRGEPLQYILGTQPFGPLEMKCRPGVLIPRPEPEAYATHLAALIRQGNLLSAHQHTQTPSSRKPPPSLRILDLCTGTGCIALLLHALLHRNIPDLHVHGVDISQAAVRLAKENTRHNGLSHTPSPPTFTQGDIFSSSLLDDLEQLYVRDDSNVINNDHKPLILVCNPPYVSRRGFARQTARSVRHWEPALAQVPPAEIPSYPYSHVAGSSSSSSHDEPEDVFYARLLDIGAGLRPAVMLFEVGDLAQALRVAGLALRHSGLREAVASSADPAKLKVEVWRDWPDAAPVADEASVAFVPVGAGDEKKEVHIRGSGHGRSVFIQCR